MRLHAVIPLKELPLGKRRLAHSLADEVRHRLILTMLADVVAILLRSAGIERVSILTRDHAIVPHGCTHIPDAADGLNAALAVAADACVAAGATAMLVVPGDIPLIECDDVAAILAARGEDTLVAAPDEAGCGTNALLVTPPRLIGTHFGPRSLLAHETVARGAGARFVLVRRPGLAFDVDEPGQLQRLMLEGGARYAFLGPDGVAEPVR
jgi:2-phospho-L-lactate guanylyltransferase